MHTPFSLLKSRMLMLAVTALVTVFGFSAQAQQKKYVPPRIAILYFNYEGPDQELASLRTQMASMLNTSLVDPSRWNLLERAEVGKLMAEQDLGASKRVNASTAAQIGKLIGARFVVMGSFYDIRNRMRVDARLVDVETGVILGSAGVKGTVEGMDELEIRLSEAVERMFVERIPQVPEPTPVAANTKRVTPPKNFKLATAIKVGKALGKMDSKNAQDKKAGQAMLSEVARENPEYAPLAKKELENMIQAG